MESAARAQLLALWQSGTKTAANMRAIVAAGQTVFITATRNLDSGEAGVTNPMDGPKAPFPQSSYIDYNPFVGINVHQGTTYYILNDGTSVLAHEFSHALDNATLTYYADYEKPAYAVENEIRRLQGAPPR